jgi:hypothetical protein
LGDVVFQVENEKGEGECCLCCLRFGGEVLDADGADETCGRHFPSFSVSRGRLGFFLSAECSSCYSIPKSPPPSSDS